MAMCVIANLLLWWHAWVTVVWLVRFLVHYLHESRPSSSSRRGWRSPSRSAYRWASTACCRPASSRRTCKCCVSWRAMKLAPILWTSEKTDVHSEAAVRLTLSWEISLPQLSQFLTPIFFHICPFCTITYCLFIPHVIERLFTITSRGTSGLITQHKAATTLSTLHTLKHITAMLTAHPSIYYLVIAA